MDGGNAAARSLTDLLLEVIELQPDEGRAVLEGFVSESLVAVLHKRSPLVFRAQTPLRAGEVTVLGGSVVEGVSAVGGSNQSISSCSSHTDSTVAQRSASLVEQPEHIPS